MHLLLVKCAGEHLKGEEGEGDKQTQEKEARS